MTREDVSMKTQEFGHKNDELLFAAEVISDRRKSQPSWKILIADDEEEVHAVTRMVLDNFIFEGRGLMLLSAYSGVETKHLLQEHPDTAIVLLDVVMEEETTGLEVVRYIRKDLRNRFVRIVLRTGQPGQAPEGQVTVDYDINDYREKTELTAQKLFTTIIGSLRAYRDLRTIEKSKKGLEQIVVASANLFELQSLKKFAAGVLTHLTAILQVDTMTAPELSAGFIANQREGDYYLLAGTGQFMPRIDQQIDKVVPKETLSMLIQASHEKRPIFSTHEFVGYFCVRNESHNLLYLQSAYNLNEIDMELIRVFSANVAVAFDNVYLNQAIIETQKEVIFTLGEVIETRSRETGSHVKRVAAYSDLLAVKCGLSEEEAELLKLASPMHDVGKIGIPDAILNKPGKLTIEEFNLVKTHPIIGHEILKNSKQRILKTAAIIALQHHEHWDGSGYPYGTSGENIHIFARITKLADVFDALSYYRVHKKAWTMDNVLEFIRKERGTQFDPVLVDLFFDNLDDLLAIRNAYPEGETSLSSF
jgi:response regulator RpfG family c-di-GMP phosphodiesterase